MVPRNTRIANAILAQVQGNCFEHRESEHPAMLHLAEQLHARSEGEQELLFHNLPLSRLLSWNRWWHLTAKVIVLVCKKKFWGLVGAYLQKTKGIPGDRLTILRANWSARGRELNRIKHST